MLIGLILTVVSIGLFSCVIHHRRQAVLRANLINQMGSMSKSGFVSTTTATPPINIELLQNGQVAHGMYKIQVDSVIILYIIDSQGSSVTVIGTKRTNKPTEIVSIMTDGVKTIVQPSKESLETLSNPEVRPVPVGSEKAFI